MGKTFSGGGSATRFVWALGGVLLTLIGLAITSFLGVLSFYGYGYGFAPSDWQALDAAVALALFHLTVGPILFWGGYAPVHFRAWFRTQSPAQLLAGPVGLFLLYAGVAWTFRWGNFHWLFVSGAGWVVWRFHALGPGYRSRRNAGLFLFLGGLALLAETAWTWIYAGYQPLVWMLGPLGLLALVGGWKIGHPPVQDQPLLYADGYQ